VQETPLVFRLVPIPDETIADGLTDIRAAVMPLRGVTEVGDILFDDYEEDIGHGALARILRIPQRTWTNPEMSIFYDGLFKAAISSAKVRSRMSYGNAEMSLQPMKWAGVR
jgi:hypothetical protein